VNIVLRHDLLWGGKCGVGHVACGVGNVGWEMWGGDSFVYFKVQVCSAD